MLVKYVLFVLLYNIAICYRKFSMRSDYFEIMKGLWKSPFRNIRNYDEFKTAFCKPDFVFFSCFQKICISDMRHLPHSVASGTSSSWCQYKHQYEIKWWAEGHIDALLNDCVLIYLGHSIPWGKTGNNDTPFFFFNYYLKAWIFMNFRQLADFFIFHIFYKIQIVWNQIG